MWPFLIRVAFGEGSPFVPYEMRLSMLITPYKKATTITFVHARFDKFEVAVNAHRHDENLLLPTTSIMQNQSITNHKFIYSQTILDKK